MIIDSHLHIGKIGKFDMPETVLIEAMEKYNIDFGLVSNIECCEFDSELNELPVNERYSQIQVNRRLLEFLKKNPKKVKGQFWIKPYSECWSEDVEQFMEENAEYFVGFKMHPFHSQIAPTDDRCRGYFEYANRKGLSIAIHTANDKHSDPREVLKVATQYPNAKFIMVHLGLGTSNGLALSLLDQAENLYGDTTWVDINRIHETLMDKNHKLMFGTDSPIDGVDTYKAYAPYFEALQTCGEASYRRLMALNAQEVFNLQL